MFPAVALASSEEVLPLRELHRAELNAQFVHDSWHARGWTDPYLFRLDGRVAGYGLIGGVGDAPRDTIIEFYVRPADRGQALPLFRALAAVSGAKSVEAQTNDTLLMLMLFDCANRIISDRILFHDAFTTDLAVPGATFRRLSEADKARVFRHSVEPVGDWGVEVSGEIVATGGILLHYNPPFADLFLEVTEPHHRRDYGSFLVQELKRTCRETGRVPAARCNASNVASRAALQKAGLLPCARMLAGTIRAPALG